MFNLRFSIYKTVNDSPSSVGDWEYLTSFTRKNVKSLRDIRYRVGRKASKSALSFTILRDEAFFKEFQNDYPKVLIGVEVMVDGEWVEPNNSRFLIDNSRSTQNSLNHSVHVECVGYNCILDGLEADFLENGYPFNLVDGKIEYTGEAREIIKNLFDAQGDNIVGGATSFTHYVNTPGSYTPRVKTKPLSTILDVINAYDKLGLITHYWNGTELNIDTINIDEYNGNKSFRLKPSPFSSRTLETTQKNLFNGFDRISVFYTDSNDDPQIMSYDLTIDDQDFYGFKKSFLVEAPSNVSSETEAITYVENFLLEEDSVRRSRENNYILNVEIDNDEWQPFVHYFPGTKYSVENDSTVESKILDNIIIYSTKTGFKAILEFGFIDKTFEEILQQAS